MKKSDLQRLDALMADLATAEASIHAARKNLINAKVGVTRMIDELFPKYWQEKARAFWQEEPVIFRCKTCQVDIPIRKVEYVGEFNGGIACCPECSGELSVSQPEAGVAKGFIYLSPADQPRDKSINLFPIVRVDHA